MPAGFAPRACPPPSPATPPPRPTPLRHPADWAFGRPVLCLALAATVPGLGAAEFRVSSAAEIAAVSPRLGPGDTLVLADGTWRDQAVVFRGEGTADRPITLRAATPGRVVLTGRSRVTVEGAHLVVSGLCLRDGGPGGDGIALQGSDCRLTQTAMIGGTYRFFVHLFGTRQRVDHCYFAGKTSESPTLQVEVVGPPDRDRIDHNHFGPRPPLGRNGGETMRVGYSFQSMNRSDALIERNLFDRCDGEIEIISNKSCGNVYRSNTFLDCAGMLTLRHGNGCRVEGNCFLGHHTKGSGGIRVIGEDHVIINNYIDGVERGAFWITSGIVNSPLVGYFRARNCLIAFNTVVDSHGPYLDLAAGLGTAHRTLLPEDITVADNLFDVPAGGRLLAGSEGVGFHWLGNLVEGAAGTEPTGIRSADLRLQRGPDGWWRPAPDSPARGAAVGSFPAVTDDIDGQPRTGPLDVGCDQISAAPVLRRPLTAAEVGPAWLGPEARDAGTEAAP